MNAAELIRTCRGRGGYTLRELAERAETSHATLAAYERGRVVPGVDTLTRVVNAAGFAVDGRLCLRRRDGFGDTARGDELLAVLALASEFPVRSSQKLRYPPFGRLR